MNKKLLALPLVLILAACGKDEPKQALECNHPAAIQSIKTQIGGCRCGQMRALPGG